MIDAYEVGISLALQDGVSAGLEVIMRELQALDAAVAASAAGLRGLMAQAQQAAAVTARAGRPLPMTVAAPGGEAAAVSAAVPAAAARQATRAEVAASPAAEMRAASVAPTSRPVATEEVRGAVQAAPRIVTAAATAPGSAAVPGGPVAPPPVAVAPAVLGTIPAVPRPVPAMVAQALGPGLGAAPGRGSGMAQPPRTLPATPLAALPASGPRFEMSVLAFAAAPDAVPRPAAAPAIRMLAPPGAAGAAALPRMPALVSGPLAPQAPRLPPAAPSAAMPAPVPGAPVFAGRPAAPPPPAAEGGRGGGDVVLDGRLVGHWLADRMGREAARPGAGTTGFDPRQSPAWTPAGTL